MSEKTEWNKRNFHHQLIMAGIAGLVDDEGYTPHEVFQLLENIKQSSFHALADMHKEYKAKHKI